jgi:hypothetical protein
MFEPKPTKPVTMEEKAQLWEDLEAMAQARPCARVGIVFFDSGHAECFCGCRHQDETTVEAAVKRMAHVEGIK